MLNEFLLTDQWVGSELSNKTLKLYPGVCVYSINCTKVFPKITSFNPQDNSESQVLLVSLFTDEETKTQILNNLPKVTQLASL